MKVNKLISLHLVYTKFGRYTGYLYLFVAGLAISVLFSCSDTNRINTNPIDFTWTFNTETEGWTADFADYPADDEEAYEFYFGYDSLPQPLDYNQGALKLSGVNHNSNLFMFIKKRITDLQPNAVYYATFTIEFATNEPGNELNAALVPGGQIYIGAGATSVEPVKVVDENKLYGLNIDKCNNSQDGEDMIVLGNVVNEADEAVYTLKTISNDKPFHCTTNEQGELWIIVGVDSGVEATTELYYNTIQVNLF